MWHKGLLAKLEQLGLSGNLLSLLTSYLHNRSLKVVVNGCTSSIHPVEASVPQGSVLGPIMWNIYFNDLLQRLPVVSAYADDCTLSHSYRREETADAIDTINRQLDDIIAWGKKWQIKFASEKTQAMIISRSREDSRLFEGKLKMGNNILSISDSANILGVDVDSSLSFDRHLEKVAHRASLRVTLLRRVSHLLDANGLMKLYKAQVRPVMEYTPLTWMSSAQCHLSLLDKVQRRAEGLIQQVAERENRNHILNHQQPQRHQLQPRQQRHYNQLDSLQHRRNVAALTVLHKAQVQHTPHLAPLRVQWRRREQNITRTVMSSDLLLQIPRTHTAMCQRAFTYAAATLWNAFTSAVDVRTMNTQQAKVAAHRWCSHNINQ